MNLKPVQAHTEDIASTASEPRTRERQAVIALSFCALSIRLKLAMGSGFWSDEAAFLHIVQSDSLGRMMSFLQYHEAHPPFFYLLMRIWVSGVGEGDLATRLLPVLLGTALVPAIYAVGRSLFSVQTALLATVLCTFSPALSEHSALARPYSLLPLLVLLSAYGLIQSLERGSWKSWVFYALGVLAMIYTHHWSWLMLAGYVVAAAAVVGLGIGNSRPKRSILREWAATHALMAGGTMPLIWWIRTQSEHGGHAPQVLKNASDVFRYGLDGIRVFFQSTAFGYVPLGDPSVVTAALRVFMGAMVLVSLVALYLLTVVSHEREVAIEPARARLRKAVMLIAPAVTFLLAMVMSVRTNMLLTRCVVMLAPLVILVFSHWTVQPSERLSRIVRSAFLGGALASYMAGLYALNRSWRSNARELAAAVAREVDKADLVVIAPEWHASSFNRYFSPPNQQINFPNFYRTGAVDYLKIRSRTADARALERLDREIIEARKRQRRVWVVWSPPADSLAVLEQVSLNLASPSFLEVGVARAAQIRAAVNARYGPPDTTLSDHYYAPSDEYLQASLFTAKSPNGK